MFMVSRPWNAVDLFFPDRMNLNEIHPLSSPSSWQYSCLKQGTMLTRRDVLNQLRSSGIRTLSALKQDCRQYENYMAAFYDFEIVRSPRGRMNSFRSGDNRYSRTGGNPHRFVRVRLLAQRPEMQPRTMQRLSMCVRAGANRGRSSLAQN